VTRINIREDGHAAGWFDDDKADKWTDDNARGPGRGETLYRTIGAKWVLHLWSIAPAAEPEQYLFITEPQARQWLTSNNLASEADRFEQPPARGRPEIGNPIRVRLGELLPAVDNLATQRQESRSDTVRHLVWVGLMEETRETSPS
jgi:hypothetical protein